MKHGILAAMFGAMTKQPIVRAAAAEQWRDSVVRLSKGAWLVAHPRTFVDLARLFASAPMRPLFRVEPRLMFKFLQDYLTADLSRSERAAMLIHHYAFLNERVDPIFFEEIVDHRLDLWELKTGDNAYRICLLFPRTPHTEGDLTLIFEADGCDIYNLSFTFGPGAIAGLDVADAMYIARVQGKGRGLDRIREATRDCVDVSPAALLLAAAEGIAQALDLDTMVGIGAVSQVMTKGNRKLENLVKAYDEFWTAAGGTRLDRHMYRLAVPSSGKPILAVKRDHRSRTHRKRRFKRSVKEHVLRAFCEIVRRPAVALRAPGSTTAV
jgi:uncharacterized protein VirK/YbjX